MTTTNMTAFLLRPLRARDPEEKHRAATPLELLYDLVLVIAVGAAAAILHHAINENHAAAGLGAFLFMFWALWWPWVNFTWFASAYDNDDALYRCLVFVQMIGALVTAVGFRNYDGGTPTILSLAGYIIMRIGMISLWVRAARGHPEGRECAYRYAVGIALCQIAWITVFYLAPSHVFMLACLPIIIAEMAVPAFAESRNPTQWHRHHIIERYGLLTIIVFGESLLSFATAIAAIGKDYTWSGELWLALSAGFVILFAMWWIYFGERFHSVLNSLRGAFVWNFAHYFIFASAAAVGAGIAVLVDHITHHSEISRALANMAVAAPVAVYLLAVWFCHDRPSGSHAKWQLPLFAALVLLTPFVSWGTPLVALLLTICLIIRIREDAN